MQNDDFQNRKIIRMASDDPSIFRPTLNLWTSAGKGGFYSKEFLGSESAQISHGVGNEKITMQMLNDRLASYLEKVKSLEETNSQLEVQIRQFLEKKGPDAHDYSHYYVTIEKLRKEIMVITLGYATLGFQFDNAKMAADDFRIKFEHELLLRQGVEADIIALKKIRDDTYVVQLHMENDVEVLKAELINLREHHQLEVQELQSQITQAGVRVEVDAPRGQDLNAIIEEIRAKYEKITLKNQEELKAWHDTKKNEVQVEVSANTAALKEANTQASESRRKMQSLEVELQSLTGSRSSFEEPLQEINQRYAMQVKQYNGIIVKREAELRQLRDDIQNQTQQYQALLNIKMKLETEIATYRRLLDGEDLL